MHILQVNSNDKRPHTEVDEAREMYDVGSLEEKLMVKTWLLGPRIGDACRLEWKWFDLSEVSEEPREGTRPYTRPQLLNIVFIRQNFF